MTYFQLSPRFTPFFFKCLFYFEKKIINYYFKIRFSYLIELIFQLSVLIISSSKKKKKTFLFKLKRKIKREKSEIVQKKRKNEEIDEDDYNEIQKDFSLLKKLKKRKVLTTKSYLFKKITN